MSMQIGPTLEVLKKKPWGQGSVICGLTDSAGDSNAQSSWEPSGPGNSITTGRLEPSSGQLAVSGSMLGASGKAFCREAVLK